MFEVMVYLCVAIILFALLLRFLPKSFFWDKLVLRTTSAEADTVIAGGASSTGGTPASLPDVGKQGVAVTDLHPGGTVEIDGKYFEAQVSLEDLKTGTHIVVTGYKHFYLLVEKAEL
jgi:membrane-bound serine protease (ClpP class)